MPLTNKTIFSYTLYRKLGEGGMAEVWYAENNIGKKASVKLLLPEFTLMPQVLDRFANEAKVMVQLNHPNIRQVYDYATLEGRPSIIMEYLEGADLSTRLKRGERFSPDTLKEWWNQIAAALNYTHKKEVVHRDIKPSNIFLCDDGQVKLLDFGIAKIRSSITMTQTGSRMGTLMYMSPEQVKDSKNLDYRTDLYSLAVSFVHLLTGQTPYDSTSSSEFDIQMKIVTEELSTDKLPSEWQNFLLPYLSKEPAQRPSLNSFSHKDIGIQKKQYSSIPHANASEKTIIEGHVNIYTPKVTENKPINITEETNIDSGKKNTSIINQNQPSVYSNKVEPAKQTLPIKTKRPALLTVLCILTFIGSGLSILAYLIYSIYFAVTFLESDFQLVLSDAPNVYLLLIPFALGVIISIFKIVGAAQMLNLRKRGYFKYITAETISFIWSLFLISVVYINVNHSNNEYVYPLVMLVYSIVFYLLFITLYTVAFKKVGSILKANNIYVKKKAPVGLMILFIFLFGIAPVSLILANQFNPGLFFSNYNSPEYVAEKYLNHITKQEWAEAKKLGTENTQQLVDMLASFGGNAEVKEVKIEEMKCEVIGEAAVCNFKSNGEADRLDMVKKDGKWLVDQKKEMPADDLNLEGE